MVSDRMRTQAYTAASRNAPSGETRMPEALRTDTGSKKKSPQGDRSLLEALNRSMNVKSPIASEHHQLIVGSEHHRVPRFDRP